MPYTTVHNTALRYASPAQYKERQDPHATVLSPTNSAGAGDAQPYTTLPSRNLARRHITLPSPYGTRP